MYNLENNKKSTTLFQKCCDAKDLKQKKYPNPESASLFGSSRSKEIMPKCANVVILVIVTNIVTLTIFSNIKHEKLPSLSEAVSIIPGYSNSGGQNGGVEHIR